MKRTLITLISVLLLAALVAGTVSASAASPVLIGIPDDATNGGRAIKLLESVGLITVDPEAGWVPELKDVTGYLYNIEIVPTQANTLPATLDDFGGATINGTYAIPTGLVPSRDGLAIESQADATGDSGNPFVNVVVARTEDKDNELYKTIQEAFQSDLVGQYLIAKYSEAFIPAFEYKDTEYTNEELLDLIDSYKTDKKGKTVVKIGVCGASNEHWNATQYVLDQNDANIYLDLVVFDAYNLPNEALNSGDIDLNSFQHKAYLAKEVGSQGYKIETIFDTNNASIAIDCARQAAPKLPIMLSFSVSTPDGHNMLGQDIVDFIDALPKDGIISVGINCVTNVPQMIPLVCRLATKGLMVSLYPNAGHPDANGHYSKTPEGLLADVWPLLENHCLNFIGGCCGTTDAHIRQMAKAIEPIKGIWLSPLVPHSQVTTTIPKELNSPHVAEKVETTFSSPEDALYEAILDGKSDKATAATKEAIAKGVAPQELINGQMIRAMGEVGQRFQDGKAFVPQLLMA